MISTTVLLAVLGSAMLHAAWNAVVKSRADPVIGIAWLSVGSGVAAGLALPFVAFPVAAAWPFILASTAIHTVYNLMLATAYSHGDFSRVYPIARGGAPLIVTLVSLAFLEEHLSGQALFAIGLILLAILGVARERKTGRRSGERRAVQRGATRVGAAGDRSLVFAGLTAVAIAGYTIADGLGARAAGDAVPYILWLFFIDAWPTVLIVMWMRRGRFRQTPRGDIVRSVAGGLLSMLAYGIVVWAMVSAPVAVVAALRESSILFAALIGVFVLKERPGPVRIAAIVLLVAAVALLRLS